MLYNNQKSTHMQQIKIYKTFVAICRWQFALAHTHTWHTHAHTHISAQFGQMSPTWQPVPALLSVCQSVRPCSCPTVALLPVRPKNFHNISAKQIARKNGNAIFGRLLRRPLPNGRHVASTHTYVSAPTPSATLLCCACLAHVPVMFAQLNLIIFSFGF